LRLKVRYHATAALHSSSGMSGPLALAAAESSLVDAFGACDANGSGQLDRATLGRVLWAQVRSLVLAHMRVRECHE
jgi:hypothetical protein